MSDRPDTPAAPATEAGREFLGWADETFPYQVDGKFLRDSILAIEREAAQQAASAPAPGPSVEQLAEIAAAGTWDNCDGSCDCHQGICMDCGCTNETPEPSPAADAGR